jgi:hypothetical protein
VRRVSSVSTTNLLDASFVQRFMKSTGPSKPLLLAHATVVHSFVAAWSIALAACSAGPDAGPVQGNGPSNGNDGGTAASGSCKITLSGGLTGTYACDVTNPEVAARFSTSDGASGFMITANNGATDATSPNILIDPGFAGDIAMQTFPSSAPGAQNGATISVGLATANGGVWTADAGEGMGAWTVSIASVTPVGGDAYGKAYVIHGVFEATCVQPGSADVNLRAEF